MTIGPGKYDDLCSYVREHAEVRPGGATIVIVLGGNRGNGFSCQAAGIVLTLLPDLLEEIARQVRNDAQRMPA